MCVCVQNTIQLYEKKGEERERDKDTREEGNKGMEDV